MSSSYFTRILRLSFLAPDITRAILHGRQPVDLNAHKLMADTRRRSIGMDSAPGSASFEPHPPPNTAHALRLQQAEGDLVRRRDVRRGGGAGTVPLERWKEIFGVSGAHIRDSLVSRDHGADANRP